jgi:hypothetical protein
MLNKSSPLKLLGQMEPNLAGSIYVRSSIKLLHLIPFGQQTWPLLLKIEHRVGRTTDAKWWQYLTWPFGSGELKNQPIRNKNCLWWPCLLMDRDGMSNLYRGPSI